MTQPIQSVQIYYEHPFGAESIISVCAICSLIKFRNNSSDKSEEKPFIRYGIALQRLSYVLAYGL